MSFMRPGRVKDTAGVEHKPDSVPGAEAPGTVIFLAPRLPAGSSGRPAPGTGDPMGGTFGLAPGGVCPAPDVATGAVSSYLAISPLP